jgi:hypothetical protein
MSIAIFGGKERVYVTSEPYFVPGGIETGF